MIQKMDNNYSYFEDNYGNQYRWSTKKQSDGKFHVEFMKSKVRGGWEHLTKTKERSFKQRKTAKAYCIKACRKARLHQSEVLKRREELKAKRKAEKKAKEPKGKEKSKINYKKKVEHTKELIKKINKKIKVAESKVQALETRKRTYTKKLKYYVKNYKKVRKQLYDEIEV